MNVMTRSINHRQSGQTSGWSKYNVYCSRWCMKIKSCQKESFKGLQCLESGDFVITASATSKINPLLESRHWWSTWQPMNSAKIESLLMPFMIYEDIGNVQPHEQMKGRERHVTKRQEQDGRYWYWINGTCWCQGVKTVWEINFPQGCKKMCLSDWASSRASSYESGQTQT